MPFINLSKIDLYEHDYDNDEVETPDVDTKTLVDTLKRVSEELAKATTEPEYVDVLNQHGFLDTLDEEGHPVCPQCHCCVMPNRGQGTLCNACNHDLLVECEADYNDAYPLSHLFC